jgi:hypothetical protein
MGSLKIPKEQSEAVFWRMAKKKTTNHKKTLHGKRKIYNTNPTKHESKLL